MLVGVSTGNQKNEDSSSSRSGGGLLIAFKQTNSGTIHECSRFDQDIQVEEAGTLRTIGTELTVKL